MISYTYRLIKKLKVGIHYLANLHLYQNTVKTYTLILYYYSKITMKNNFDEIYLYLVHLSIVKLDIGLQIPLTNLNY